MNTEWKRKWLEALRSGQYKQAKSALRTETGYCCLGVLCDLVSPTSWGPPCSGIYDFGHEHEELHLTHQVRRLANISTSHCSIDGILDRENSEISLAALNDAGCTFDQLADVIDRFF